MNKILKVSMLSSDSNKYILEKGNIYSLAFEYPIEIRSMKKVARFYSDGEEEYFPIFNDMLDVPEKYTALPGTFTLRVIAKNDDEYIRTKTLVMKVV